MQKIIIGQISNQRAAQAFCDFLKSREVNAWTEPDGVNFHLLISDPNAEDFACSELRDFLENPTDNKYLDASWNEGTTNQGFTTSVGSQPGSGGLRQFLSRAGMMTKGLVLTCTIVTLATSFGNNIELTKYLMIADITLYDGRLNDILSGQIWRLLTPVFLHFMTIHLLFNMMWLWDLGGSVEKNQSSGFLLFFVVSIGIMSNIVQYLGTGPAFGGMSGVVYGLLGYTWIRSMKPGSNYQLHKSIIVMMLAWLVLGFTGWIGPIGNEAHLSGLIFGMAYGFAWNQYE